jgi:DNA-binding XRE family transcriptional regulator
METAKEQSHLKTLVHLRCMEFGYTEAEVAERIGISNRTLTKYYKDPDQMRIETAKRLGRVLRLSVIELMGLKKF